MYAQDHTLKSLLFTMFVGGIFDGELLQRPPEPPEQSAYPFILPVLSNVHRRKQVLPSAYGDTTNSSLVDATPGNTSAFTQAESFARTGGESWGPDALDQGLQGGVGMTMHDPFGYGTSNPTMFPFSEPWQLPSPMSDIPSMTERDTRSPSGSPGTPRIAAPVGIDTACKPTSLFDVSRITAAPSNLDIPPMTLPVDVTFSCDDALRFGPLSLKNLADMPIPEIDFNAEYPFLPAEGMSQGTGFIIRICEVIFI